MNNEKPIAAATNGKARMAIVANSFERAPEILSKYMKKITGGDFEILPTPTVMCSFMFEKKEHNGGFSYRIIDKDIIFEAEDDQRAVYAVYDFLERVIGCRYYTSKCEKIIQDANLTIYFPAYEYSPKIGYREVYYRDYGDPEFAEKLKASPFEKHEGWGFWCHSFQELVSEKEYYETHPEYFSLIDGHRVAKNAQLCLSNPDVLKVAVENLRKEMEKRPEAKYWSVSQNDNAACCQCEQCRKIDEEEGSPMGSVLRFVNKVAAEFPDKIISTLAYWYTRKPPKKTRPADNVHIMLCNIEANRGAPIETDERSKDSREELAAWEKICGNIFLWDYCIQFRNLVSPFPNLRVIGPNIKFFAEHSVKSLFSQANRENGGEFCELRGYLLAKLMWNPDLNPREVIEDFVNGYYKQAAPFILEYIDKIHDGVEKSGGELNIFGGPLDYREAWLSEDCCKEYDAAFDAAEEAAAADGDTLFKVKTARLPLLYAQITLGYGDKAARLERIAKFAAQSRKTGLSKVEEWEFTVDSFVTDQAARIAE